MEDANNNNTKDDSSHLSDAPVVAVSTEEVKPPGRNRICKICRFSSTDSRKFLHHQMYSHGEENENSSNESEIISTTETPSRHQSACSPVTSDVSGQLSVQSPVTVQIKPAPRRRSSDITNNNNSNNNNNNKEKMAAAVENIIMHELMPPIVNINDSGDDNRSERENDGVSPNAKDLVMRSGNIQIRKYVCMKCAFETTSAKVFLHHQVDIHSENILIYECDVCEYATKYKQKLPRHRKLHFMNKDGTEAAVPITHENNSFLDSSLLSNSSEGLEEGAENDSDDKLQLIVEANNNIAAVYGNAKTQIANANFNATEIADSDNESELTIDMSKVEEQHPSTRESTPTIPITAPKRMPRQEVDPGKYVVIQSDQGLKYACSKCTSVYSWRKSLNKHWKEKHPGEVPDLKERAKKMAQLKENNQLVKFTVSPNASLPNTPSPFSGAPSHSGSSTPRNTPSFVNGSQFSPSGSPFSYTSDKLSAPQPMPNVIGPFITNTILPTFMHPAATAREQTPGQKSANIKLLNLKIAPSHKRENLQANVTTHVNPSSPVTANGGVLDLSTHVKMEPVEDTAIYSNTIQNEPLDFSCKPFSNTVKSELLSHLQTKKVVLSGNETVSSLLQNIYIKREPAWSASEDNDKNLKEVLHNAYSSTTELDKIDLTKHQVLQCTKCGFIAKSLVDYSTHMGTHQNKRAFKCAECQEHFTGIDDLNKHFTDKHIDRIIEHREVMQKVPHGLLQTYHLLNVPVNKLNMITNPSYHGPKQLKCSMCGFVAKWPAELQKHAVSHSEERPFICMVCGSTYKWKWDLVKHFEKSHHTLPNPYKRREGTPQGNENENDASSDGFPSKREQDGENIANGNGQSAQKKKRHLSDTDIPLMQENQADENVHDNDNGSDKESDPGVYVTENNVLFQDPSEYPHGPKDAIAHLRLQHMQNLAKAMQPLPLTEKNLMEFDAEESDRYMQYCRPVNETTQKIIAEALRQRLSKASSDGTICGERDSSSADVLLPYKCPTCEYRARWPSEITQHMKNHSDLKPYHCPRCSYRSKWKWDVVKHLKRCGGGTIKDVIDRSSEDNADCCSEPSPEQVQNSVQNAAYLVGPFASDTVNPLSGSNKSDSPESASSALAAIATTVSAQYNKKRPFFQGLISEGMYHCFKCSFVGQTLSELRKHAVVHSEEKPFSCQTCGYSSKWKGDVKRHLKSYDHVGMTQEFSQANGKMDAINLFPDGNASEECSAIELSSEESPQDKQLYKCTQCEYVTYKKYSFDTHLKIHGNLTTMSNNSQSKFKCKQCDYQAPDLPTFLQHKVAHTQSTNVAENEADNEENPQNLEVSSRTLRLKMKHRRKPVQQFQCTKCPYTCFKRSGLDLHLSMHEPRGSEALKCLFCDYNVYSRNLLNQHLKLHPEYDEEKHGSMLPSRDDDGMSTENESKDTPERIVDLMSAAMSTTDEYENAEIAEALHSSKFIGTPPLTSISSKEVSKRLSCEWCNRSFDHLNTLYQHARNMHPFELSAQEMNTSINQSQVLDLVSIPRGVESPHSIQAMSGAVECTPKAPSPNIYHLLENMNAQQQRVMTFNDKLLMSTSKTANNPNEVVSACSNSASSVIMTNAMDMYSIKMVRTLAALGDHQSIKKGMTTNPGKRSQKHKCNKCPFVASNMFSYYRHMERHGGSGRHKCAYCDYSIDRLNLLYQHMKGAHYVQIGSDTHLVDETALGSEDMDIEFADGGYPDKVKPELTTSEAIMQDDASVLKSMAANGGKPNIVITEDTLWRGVPIQICFVDGRKNYKCPYCDYISNNASNATNHVRQHGTNRKYKCEFCDYSVDNLRLVYHHMESIHKDIIIESGLGEVFAKTFAAIASGADTPPQEPGDGSKIIENPLSGLDLRDSLLSRVLVKETSSPSNELRETVDFIVENGPKRFIPCPRCPFRAKNKDALLKHLEMHEYTGRFKCQHCSYSAERLNLLTQHSRVHMKKDGSLEMVPYPEVNLAVKRKQSEAEIQKRKEKRISAAASISKMSEKKQVKLKALQGGFIGRIRYKCSRCPFTTFCRNNIIKHRRQHLVTGKYKCQKCNYSAGRWYLLQQHMRFHQNKEEAENAADKGLDGAGLDGNTERFQDFILDPDDEDTVAALQKLIDEKSMTKKGMSLMRGDGGGGGADSGIMDPNGELDLMDTMGDDGDEADMEDDMEDDMADFDDDEEDMVQTPDSESKIGEHDQPLSTSATSTASPSFPLGVQFRNYKCKNCPFSSNKASEFRKHQNYHIVSQKYTCDYCTYSINRLNLLTQHRKLHSHQADFNPNPGALRLLRMLSASNTDIAELPSDHDSHISSEGFVSDVYPLEGCDDPVQSLADNEMVEAAEMLHMAKTVSDDSYPYACSICPYRCASGKSLNIHSNMHGLNRKYICDLCDWSVDRLNLLYNHRRVHIKQSEFQSSPDPSIFINTKADNSTPSDLSVKKTETFQLCSNRKIYKCKLCPFSCNNHNNFDYHMWLHNTPSKYTCAFCTYSVGRWNLLTQHMKLHRQETGAKSQTNTETSAAGTASTGIISPGGRVRLRCPKCLYHTSNKKLLDLHVAMHETTEKALNLHFAKQDSTTHALYLHLPTLHDITRKMTYSCKFCDYITDQYQKLQQHVSTHDDSKEDKSPNKSEESDAVDKPTPGVVSVKELEQLQPFLKTEPYSADAPRDLDNVDELKCDRCPFLTITASDLKSHISHHGMPDKYVCPSCDYGCCDEDSLLTHTQLHFLGTQLDIEMVHSLIAQQERKKRDRANQNSSDAEDDVTNDVTDINEKKIDTEDAKPIVDASLVISVGENDSNNGASSTEEQKFKNEIKNETNSVDSETAIINTKSEDDSDGGASITKPSAALNGPTLKASPAKTKVYVCQYCEREFEEKSQMIKHEKQHLIGN